MLPAAFPNLLVNGASGIAVGMATNMIPHNLGEVVAAARWLINHPDAELDKLMEFVPAPTCPPVGCCSGSTRCAGRTRPGAAWCGCGRGSRPARSRAAGAGRRSP